MFFIESNHKNTHFIETYYLTSPFISLSIHRFIRISPFLASYMWYLFFKTFDILNY